MRRLKNLESSLVLAEQWALVALVVFMVGLAFLQVLLRTFWSTGILWADTLLRHLVLWVGFLGAALAAAGDRQFAMDLSVRFTHGKAKLLIQLSCHLFAAVVSLLLFQASLSFFREEYSHAETLFAIGTLNFPAWPFELILPGGFALLLAHYALRACLCLEGAKS